MGFHHEQQEHGSDVSNGHTSRSEQEKSQRRATHPKKTRRGFLSTVSTATAASLLGGLAFSIQGCGGNYSAPPPPPGDDYSGTDDQLLEEIEKAAFLFFWEQADPSTGQVKDRALAAGNDSRTVSSIAATGYGLAALCIGDQHGYQPHANIVTRVQNTLSFLANTLQPMGMNGFSTTSWT